jgi:hypothetical protein
MGTYMRSLLSVQAISVVVVVVLGFTLAASSSLQRIRRKEEFLPLFSI